ncbi:E3 ubiquitin-protein ligase NEURL3 isoform X2 [Mustela nigripes]|nr:E3 ubiquitin-protein ligase NEURL3 isoform X2 [Mustela nigripes]
MLPEGSALLGDVIHFWVNCRGRLYARVNAGPRLLLRKGVPLDAPLWAVMDVYGTTKAIELLDTTASVIPSTMPRAFSDETLQPQVMHTSAAPAPVGSSGTQPSVLCVVGRSRPWPPHEVPPPTFWRRQKSWSAAGLA